MTGFFACIDGKFHLLKLTSVPCRDVNKRRLIPGKNNKRWDGFFYEKFDWPKVFIPHCKKEWRCNYGRFGLDP
jgi:hypothetical protein